MYHKNVLLCFWSCPSLGSLGFNLQMSWPHSPNSPWDTRLIPSWIFLTWSCSSVRLVKALPLASRFHFEAKVPLPLEMLNYRQSWFMTGSWKIKHLTFASTSKIIQVRTFLTFKTGTTFHIFSHIAPTMPLFLDPWPAIPHLPNRWASPVPLPVLRVSQRPRWPWTGLRWYPPGSPGRPRCPRCRPWSPCFPGDVGRAGISWNFYIVAQGESNKAGFKAQSLSWGCYLDMIQWYWY